MAHAVLNFAHRYDVAYYANVLDPAEQLIFLYCGNHALQKCAFHYQNGGECNVIGLPINVDPKEYLFPVFRKDVAIYNDGALSCFIAMLIDELMRQGALRVFGVMDNKLVVTK